MTGISAVGVNNNLSAGKTAVALRSARNKTACGININLCLVVYKVCVDYGIYNILNYIGANLLKFNIRTVL